MSKNRVLAEFRQDFWMGVPGPHDPYEWVVRGWMDGAENGFKGMYMPFRPTAKEVAFAAKVILRLGSIKGIRTTAEVGSPAEIINAGFGLPLVASTPEGTTP